MSKKCQYPTKNIILLAVVICIALLFTHTFLYAQTNSISETTQVSLAWDENATPPDGYYIYQRMEGQVYNYEQPVWATANNTTTIYNLDYDTNYYFFVRAFVGDMVSDDSNEVSFISPSLAPTVTTHTITTGLIGNGSISPVGSINSGPHHSCVFYTGHLYNYILC